MMALSNYVGSGDYLYSSMSNPLIEPYKKNVRGHTRLKDLK